MEEISKVEIMETGNRDSEGGAGGSGLAQDSTTSLQTTTATTDSTTSVTDQNGGGESGDQMGATGDAGTEGMEKGALSPLTGSYLLIVLAEPQSEEDREVIIQRLIKGKKYIKNG